MLFPPKAGAIIPCLICVAFNSTGSPTKGKLFSGKREGNVLAGLEGPGKSGGSGFSGLDECINKLWSTQWNAI